MYQEKKDKDKAWFDAENARKEAVFKQHQMDKAIAFNQESLHTQERVKQADIAWRAAQKAERDKYKK